MNRDFNNLIKLIETGNKIFTPGFTSNNINININNSKDLEKIELICNKFHSVARQMQSRYNSRPTLKITDEYDVQDLFHSLLTLHFNDIRKEEYVPSFAGINSRADFFLKEENIVIEIKKAGTNKKIWRELLEDIASYQRHPDCKTLVCFIYDPENKMGNPRGFERDLES